MTAATVVYGLGRSGTSLLMQMLHAAGLECLGSGPGFEVGEFATYKPKPLGRHVARKALGKAVKVLHPTTWPEGVSARFLLTTRDPHEQAKSMVKFGRVFDLQVGPAAVPALEGVNRRDRDAGQAMATALGMPFLVVPFEALIETPGQSAIKIARFLELPMARVPSMVAQVRRRTSKCFPGIFEIDLFRQAGAVP